MNYVAGGWGATAVILAAYVVRTLRRGRTLARGLGGQDGARWR